MNFIVPLLVLFFLIVFDFRKSKRIQVSTILIGVYFLSVTSSIFLPFLFDKYYFYYDVNLVGSLYFILILFFFLLPFSFIRFESISEIRLPDVKYLNLISYIMIALSFLSIIYFSNVLYKLSNYDDLSGFRHLLVNEGNPFVTVGFINTISGVVATFFIFPMFLSFVYFVGGFGYKISILLFISSFSYPLFVLSYFGRDGLLFWLIAFFSLVILFREFLSDFQFKRLRRIFFQFLVFLGSIFILISLIRFGELSKTLYSVLDYLGQPLINFSRLFDLDIIYTGGSRSFPLIFGEGGSPGLSEQVSGFGQDDLAWTFGSFIKNLYIDFGPFITLLISIFLSLGIYLYSCNVKNVNVFRLVFLFCYSQILMQGVFYFRQYNDVGNFYILCLLFISILDKFIRCDNVIYKKFV